MSIQEQAGGVFGGIGDFLGDAYDTVKGTFQTGLDQLSKELDFRRQLELLKFQDRMDKSTAAKTATNEPYIGDDGWAGAQNSSTGQGLGFGAVNPIALALVGLAGVLIIKS